MQHRFGVKKRAVASLFLLWRSWLLAVCALVPARRPLRRQGEVSSAVAALSGANVYKNSSAARAVPFCLAGRPVLPRSGGRFAPQCGPFRRAVPPTFASGCAPRCCSGCARQPPGAEKSLHSRARRVPAPAACPGGLRRGLGARGRAVSSPATPRQRQFVAKRGGAVQ